LADFSEAQFRIEPLDGKNHDRAAFFCGSESLDRYLKQQASQDVEKRVAAVFVLTSDGITIAGYYTLSQYSVAVGDLSPEVLRRIKPPRYPELPATMLGRLARSTGFKGRRLGELLLMDALKRALDHSRSIASVGVIVDAKDHRASLFYASYGFAELPEHPNRLFMPMATIAKLFA
jgi:ribosomal protein S18 acetylase RimI-like enzyme